MLYNTYITLVRIIFIYDIYNVNGLLVDFIFIVKCISV